MLAVLLTGMHHDANIVLEHKEALDATGRRTPRGHGHTRAAYDVYTLDVTGVLDAFFSTTLSILSCLTAGESDLFVGV